MRIDEIDKNLKVPTVTQTDVEWHDAENACFSLHGIFYEESTDRYMRMPTEIAKKVSDGVNILAPNTSGGRIRFETDSPYVAIKAAIPKGYVMRHMPMVGSHGFSLYADNCFEGMYGPEVESFIKDSGDFYVFDGVRSLRGEKKIREINLFFPLYNGVKKLQIGLQKGSVLKEAKEYGNKKKVVFYGSSITQGGCASRPGNDYAGMLSRWLDFDYVNLGFSGNGKAEPIMQEYLAGLHADVYVLDYDYNAPSVEWLKDTHYSLYQTIRKANSKAQIILISKPDFEYSPTAADRRNVILDTYKQANANGDKDIFFIDGEKLFGDFNRDACTVDTCHPNDFGFFRMAEYITPYLKKCLEE